MNLRTFAVVAFVWSVIALCGCRATYLDVSAEAPYKEHIGKACEVTVPLRAHGVTFKGERDQKTDAVSIWNPGFTGPEVTFILLLQPGTKFTFLEARECTNCPFDRSPEYRVRVSPEPPQFEGKPAYLSVYWLDQAKLRCSGGASAS